MPNKPWSPVSPLPGALLLVVLFALLTVLPGAVDVLRYQTDAIAAGEYWRLFTGHFVHLGWQHAVLNSAGTLLLAGLLWRDLPARDWWAVTLLAPLVISLALWWRRPELYAYVGFSGVLHGLMYCVVIRLVPELPRLAVPILLLLLGRQVWEQTALYNPDYLRGFIGGRVMPDAHLFGALTGALWGLYSLWRDRQLAKPVAS